MESSPATLRTASFGAAFGRLTAPDLMALDRNREPGDCEQRWIIAVRSPCPRFFAYANSTQELSPLHETAGRAASSPERLPVAARWPHVPRRENRRSLYIPD